MTIKENFNIGEGLYLMIKKSILKILDNITN